MTLTWPKLIKVEEKVLTEDEKMKKMAEKRADFLIQQLGPSAEILDHQQQELNGLSLKDMLVEKEWVKLRDQADAKRQRQKAAEDRRLERETLATLDILDGWDEYYFLTVNGQRIKKLKKLEVPCPFCGEPLSRPRGALVELWEWRQNHQGVSSAYMTEPPIKSESLTCQKCGKAYNFLAQVVI